MSPGATKKIEAEFFKTNAGNEPVKDELLKLGRPIKTEIGADIYFVELNWKIDKPYVDQLRQGNGPSERTIYEVRSSVQVGNVSQEYRTLFFVYDNRMVLTHLFNKKSQKTPKKEIDIAWERMKAWVKEASVRKVKASKATRKKTIKKK